MKYRIVEEITNLTKRKKIYIQKEKKKWLTKKIYWKNVIIRNYEVDSLMLLTFNTIEEAQNWINCETEAVTKIYHY